MRFSWAAECDRFLPGNCGCIDPLLYCCVPRVYMYVCMSTCLYVHIIYMPIFHSVWPNLVTEKKGVMQFFGYHDI